MDKKKSPDRNDSGFQSDGETSPKRAKKSNSSNSENSANSQSPSTSGLNQPPKRIERTLQSSMPKFKTLACPFSGCDKVLKTYKQLEHHTNIFHRNGGFECRHCNMFLESDEDRAHHIGTNLKFYYL